jgi:protoporphyrinogen oxidase
MTYSTSIRPLQAPGSRYDAIVIGAGLSGLTAAAYLAQAGARVLVCEQAEQVGGLFNSFRRGGYQFYGSIRAVKNSAMKMPMLTRFELSLKNNPRR